MAPGRPAPGQSVLPCELHHQPGGPRADGRFSRPWLWSLSAHARRRQFGLVSRSLGRDRCLLPVAEAIRLHPEGDVFSRSRICWWVCPTSFFVSCMSLSMWRIASTEPDAAKAKLGFSNHPGHTGNCVLLTTDEAVEHIIDAMPADPPKPGPHAVYVVLGATHPNLVRRSGRSLSRDPAGACAPRKHGVEDHVVFLDQFVDQDHAARFHLRCPTST